MASARFGRLTKAWENCRLSKSRQAKGLQWIRWSEDADEDETEPNASTLTMNCPMVLCMFECLQQLTLVSIDGLSKAAACWHSSL